MIYFSAKRRAILMDHDEFTSIVYHKSLDEAVNRAKEVSESNNVECYAGALSYRVKPQVTISIEKTTL